MKTLNEKTALGATRAVSESENTSDMENNNTPAPLEQLKGVEQLKHVYRALRFLHPTPGEVFEVRALTPQVSKSKYWEGYASGKSIISGYFNDLEKATKAVAGLDSEGFKGIYVTLNPVNPALLARANNRLKVAESGGTTSDQDITLLRWLLVDIDPKRPAGISSSDEQHKAALDHAKDLMGMLSDKGWPSPLYGDSGNGAHLVYRLSDLANTEENKNLLKGTLAALNQLYNVEKPDGKGGVISLDIDRSVHNPARISKIYGTFARKGEDVPEYPHRQAYAIDLPQAPQPVLIENLHAIIEEAGNLQPKAPTRDTDSINQGPGMSNGKLNLGAYLEHYGVSIRNIKQHQGATLHVLESCLFDESHTGGEASIVQNEQGALSYQCFHASCQGRTWKEARQIISGADSLAQFVEGYTPRLRSQGTAAPKEIAKIEKEIEQEKTMELARELFPRTPFPWHVLPDEIAESFRQLARSCACGDDSLPGTALAILASALGRAIKVSPKSSWEEPAILWTCDIRNSGDGKTPVARALLEPIEKAQKEENKRQKKEMDDYRKSLDEWAAMPNADKRATKKPTEPRQARGYLVTNLTIEGLHDDLDGHQTGGIVVCQDELSSFISSQNQYKSKGGNDRESWLCLHDGKPARIKRASKTVSIEGASISLFGGIQPGVFQRAFSDDGGVFLVDGTIFRFLLTYTPPAHYPLTAECWAGTNKETWGKLIERAFSWADGQRDEGTGCIETPHCLMFDSEAQARFITWRNEIDLVKSKLAPTLQGFIPKAAGYAARLAGLLHALWQFSSGEAPRKFLGLADIDRAIEMMSFYLGQTVDAIQLIADENHKPPDVSEKITRLAEVLEQLRCDVDSGRLAVGYIQERFNDGLPKEKQLAGARAMGALLRSASLKVSDGRHRANGKISAFCLEWDEETENFLKTSSRSSRSSRGECPSSFVGENQNYSASRSSRNGDNVEPIGENVENKKKTRAAPRDPAHYGAENIENVEKQISNNSEKTDNDGLDDDDLEDDGGEDF